MAGRARLEEVLDTASWPYQIDVGLWALWPECDPHLERVVAQILCREPVQEVLADRLRRALLRRLRPRFCIARVWSRLGVIVLICGLCSRGRGVIFLLAVSLGLILLLGGGLWLGLGRGKAEIAGASGPALCPCAADLGN